MWVIICKNNPIHTHTCRCPVPPPPPIRDYVAFGIMSHSGLCRSALCRIWGYVVRHNIAFSINCDEVEYLALLLMLYCIWTSRYQRKISYTKIENNMEFLFSGIIKSCTRLKNLSNTSASLWCRHWGRTGDDGEEGVRHGRGWGHTPWCLEHREQDSNKVRSW